MLSKTEEMWVEKKDLYLLLDVSGKGEWLQRNWAKIKEFP